MLFLDGVSFIYILVFIVAFNVLRRLSNHAVLLNIALLCGTITVLKLVIDIPTLLIMTGICAATYFTALHLYKATSRETLGVAIAVLVALFVLRNYQLAGVELVKRVGMSYILFRLIHFLVDSHGHKIANYNLVTFLNYILFFPTFLAGPIDQYNNFKYWISQPRQPYRFELIKTGIFRIALGVIKKYYLVPILYDYAVDFSEFSNAFPWQMALMLSLIVYSFYILFDFSGYSDIAIGTAYLIGIKTPENFDWPYLSSNISMFWKRWHMTFSMFLFQYVFKPVAVSLSQTYQKAPRLFITCLGYLITFAICGMWHGNTFNFIYWGLWHATGLIIFKLWSTYAGPAIKARFGYKLTRVSQILSVILTFLFVTCGWFFFNYSSADIKAITRSIAATDNDDLSVQSIRASSLGFKVLFNAIQPGDSLVQIQYKTSESQTFFKLEDQPISADNAYYIVPENQSDALYIFRVRSVGKNRAPAQWHHQLQYLNHPVSQTPLQAMLFPTGVQWVSISESRILSEPTLALPAGFRKQTIKAFPHFFAGYGWSLVLEYMGSPVYRVEIRYKHEGSETWVTYEAARDGKFSYAHIHGNASYAEVNRNLLPGNYEVMIRYLHENKKSSWIRTQTTIPNYSNEQAK